MLELRSNFPSIRSETWSQISNYSHFALNNYYAPRRRNVQEIYTAAAQAELVHMNSYSFVMNSFVLSLICNWNLFYLFIYLDKEGRRTLGNVQVANSSVKLICIGNSHKDQ